MFSVFRSSLFSACLFLSVENMLEDCYLLDLFFVLSFYVVKADSLFISVSLFFLCEKEILFLLKIEFAEGRRCHSFVLCSDSESVLLDEYL